MAGRGHGGQHEVAEPDFAAVGDHPADVGGGKGLVHARLRIVAGWARRC